MHEKMEMHKSLKSCLSFCITGRWTWILEILGILVCLSSSFAAQQCGVPPFVGTGVKPNVLIMLDNSGSMKEPMYRDKNLHGWQCKNGTHADFNPSVTYYGIFESDKTYTYDDSIPVDESAWTNGPYQVGSGKIDTGATGAFKENVCNPETDSNCWDGNFLNWLVT